MDFFSRLFDTSDFPARWHCGAWSSGHGWLHILSDLGVWSAYVAIPCVLGYFVVRRKDVPFRTLFWLFGAFILACGTTHLMEALIFWWPAYRLAGVIKLFTAVVSWATVVALVPVVPRALALRSPEELGHEIAARKRAEEALRQTNAELERRVEERTADLARAAAAAEAERERFQATFEQAAVGIAHVGLDGRWLRVNRKLCDVVGYRPHELLEMSFQDLTHPDDLEADLASVRRLLAGETETYSLRKRYFRKDRVPVWINLTVSVVRTPEGRPKYFIAVVEDITEQRRSEEALRESEARFRQLAELMPQLAWMARPDGHIYWYNLRWYEYTGTALEQMEGWGWQRVHDPAELPRVLERWKASIATGRPFDMVFPLRGKDGAFRPFLTRCMPLRGPDGRITHWFGTNTDISEQKRVEDSLRESEQRFARFMQHLPGLTWIKDLRGRYVYANDAATRAFRTPRDRLYGKTDAEVFPPETAARFRSADEQALASEAGVQLIEALEHEDGVHFSMVRKFPILGPDGKVALVGGLALDVTDRLRAEEKLRHQEEDIRRLNAELEQRVRDRTAELEAANKELEAFSYSVSHDLRAPLRAIDGFSRILQQEHAGELSAPGREHLQLVRDNARQMGQLVDDLLAFSRLGRQPIRKQTVEPAEIVRRCLEETRGERQGRRVEVTVGDLAPCRGEPSLLKQVWLNLLANALTYTRRCEVARVEVGCRQAEDGAVVYHVRDNGVGFDMRYAHKLFGVFQRLHRQEDYEGTGVGLAIVQRVVHRHGGRVWAEAEPGRGATFYFTLGEGGDRE